MKQKFTEKMRSHSLFPLYLGSNTLLSLGGAVQVAFLEGVALHVAAVGA